VVALNLPLMAMCRSKQDVADRPRLCFIRTLVIRGIRTEVRRNSMAHPKSGVGPTGLRAEGRSIISA
jgi:hypothetical protein